MSLNKPRYECFVKHEGDDKYYVLWDHHNNVCWSENGYESKIWLNVYRQDEIILAPDNLVNYMKNMCAKLNREWEEIYLYNNTLIEYGITK